MTCRDPSEAEGIISSSVQGCVRCESHTVPGLLQKALMLRSEIEERSAIGIGERYDIFLQDL